jgi:two-component system chemotaxis response regulator CheV
VEHELIEVIDVEKVMKEVIGGREEASKEVLDQQNEDMYHTKHILVVDDSSVARNQLKRVCDQIGVECTLLKDGQEAWEHLQQLEAEGTRITDQYTMIISDVEMPRMDGYTLATKVKADLSMKSIYMILHTSLSGVFNTAMVQKVGADEFLAKFDPDTLAAAIQNQIKKQDRRFD